MKYGAGTATAGVTNVAVGCFAGSMWGYDRFDGDLSDSSGNGRTLSLVRAEA